MIQKVMYEEHLNYWNLQLIILVNFASFRRVRVSLELKRSDILELL